MGCFGSMQVVRAMKTQLPPHRFWAWLLQGGLNFIDLTVVSPHADPFSIHTLGPLIMFLSNKCLHLLLLEMSTLCRSNH